MVVGVVAVLTLGIGQIFGSVSRLVGTGAAVAEVDQLARTVEAQLRDDFRALNAMAADETFLAIRSTRLGDFDLDADFEESKGEVDLYLTRDDEEADLRAEVDPYEETAKGRRLSRAVTVRLDEIMFIGQSGTGFGSFQGGDAQGALAQHALISYGHGLRPPLDEDERETNGEPPRRLHYADGYFGQRGGEDNRFAPGTSIRTTGRNRYAADFTLTRQALLLLGPSALGYPNPSVGVPSPPMLGFESEIGIFVRDLEVSGVYGGVDQADDIDRWPLGGYAPTASFGPRNGRTVSKPHPLRHGRTDVCAMTRDQVQSWFEGGFTVADGPFPADSLPGQLAQVGPQFRFLNEALWERSVMPGSFTGQPEEAFLENLRGIQSAIAGAFCRKLFETEPPDLRFDPSEFDAPIPDARDRRMDVHAILAEHCGSFEVAWSDGSVWDGGVSGKVPLIMDLDGDGRGTAPNEREIMPGAVIWFDMDFTYRDFWDGRGTWAGLAGSSDAQKASRYPRPSPDPEMGLSIERVFDRMPPPNDAIPTDRLLNDGEALTVMEDTDPFVSGAYSTKFTQARFERSNNDEAQHEYLAVWGFNPPVGYDRDLEAPFAATQERDTVGNYVRDVAWAKPRLIRVRVTLHDSQNRLDGGKPFEFIFRVDLK